MKISTCVALSIMHLCISSSCIDNSHPPESRKTQREDKKMKISTVEISCDISPGFQNMVLAGNYESVQQDVVAEHFPLDPSENGDAEILLVPFDPVIRAYQAPEALAKMDLDPIGMACLLSLGAQKPDLQMEFSILAVGIDWNGIYPGLGIELEGFIHPVRGLNTYASTFGVSDPKLVRYAAVHKAHK